MYCTCFGASSVLLMESGMHVDLLPFMRTQLGSGRRLQHLHDEALQIPRLRHAGEDGMTATLPLVQSTEYRAWRRDRRAPDTWQTLMRRSPGPG